MTRPPVLLYLHIPKVAGTTLSKCIQSQCASENRYKAEPDPEYPWKYMIHDGVYYYWRGFFKPPDLQVTADVQRVLARGDLRAVVGHFWFGFHRYVSGPSTYATMLRDPVERIVSLYAHLVEHEFPQPLPYHGMSLHEFVTNPPFREVDNDQTRRVAGEEPQLGRCTTAMLKRAKQNLRQHFSVVGVTERFDETLMLLKQTFGWTKSLSYYPTNQSGIRPTTSSLPPETLDAVRERNELDLKLYCFAQELLGEAIAKQDEAFHDELAAFQTSQRGLYAKWAKRIAEHAQS